MFAKPRVKKSILPPPNKRRKTTSAVEEISFDNDARQEYLTGFHKRKLQRVKNAQEEAAKRARQEKIETRKQLREERKREVEEHVGAVNKILRESGSAGHDLGESEEEEEQALDEWDGFPDKPELDLIDEQEEYIDEDRYTTVTVESVNVSRDGLNKREAFEEDEKDPEADNKETEPEKEDDKTSRPKKQKKKFRYETKLERSLEGGRQKARHRAKRPAS